MIFSKTSSLRISVSLFLWLFTYAGSYGADLEKKDEFTRNYLLKLQKETDGNETIEAEPESDMIGNCREEIGSINFNLIKTPSSAANVSDKLLSPYKELNKAFKNITVTIPLQDQTVQDLLKMKKPVTYQEDRRLNKALKKININIDRDSRLNFFLRKPIPVKHKSFIVDRKQKDIKQMKLYDLLKHILFISSDHDPVTMQRCPAELVLLIHREIEKYLRSNIKEIQESGIDTILKEVLGETYYAYFKREMAFEAHFPYTNPGYEEYRTYLKNVCESNLIEYQYYDDGYSDDYLKELSVPDEQEEVVSSNEHGQAGTLFIGCLAASAAAGSGRYCYNRYKNASSADPKDEGKPHGKT